MSPISAKDAYQQIVEHVEKQGGNPSDWYAGIASDWEKRLFSDHNVPRKEYWWIIRACPTSDAARNVEHALVEYGCDGGGGGGDKTTVFVYAYLKSPTTVEN